MRGLILWGAIASIGLSALPVIAQVSDTQPKIYTRRQKQASSPSTSSAVTVAQVRALVEALRQAAPQTGTKNDGLYSDWKIEPDNIPRWSKQCIGRSLTPAEFEADTDRAREILVCVMSNVFRDQYRASGNNESVAVRRTASWWMTGVPTNYQQNPTAAYTQQVLRFYQQQRGSNQSTTDSPTSSPKPYTLTPTKPPDRSAAQPAQINEAQVGALVEALRLAAPKTNSEKLYSEWKIQPGNIPRWSKQCIGRSLTPSEFESSPVKARKILVCVMGDVLQEQYRESGNDESVAVQRSASWWMTGKPTGYKESETASYTQKVLGYYQQLREK